MIKTPPKNYSEKFMQDLIKENNYYSVRYTEIKIQNTRLKVTLTVVTIMGVVGYVL